MAIILSLLCPGLGHIHVGWKKTGFLFLALSLFSVLSFYFFSGSVWYLYLTNFFALWICFVFPLVHLLFLLIKKSFEPSSFSWISKLLIFGFFVTLTLLSKQFSFYRSYSIPAESMLPTLISGDAVLVEKISALDIKRGDIIVFKRSSDNKALFAKRVMALGGETIEIEKGIVIIDGQEITREIHPTSDAIISNFTIMNRIDDQSKAYLEKSGERAYTVLVNNALTRSIDQNTLPMESFYVLGDNRENSLDSRMFGYVEKDNIVGKVKYIIYNTKDERLFSRSGIKL